MPGCLNLNRRSNHFKLSTPVETEFLSLLPSAEVAAILIDIFFDRIHWFTLVFHQTDFRRSFRDIYDCSVGSNHGNSNRIGFLSGLLAAFALSLQYAGSDQERPLGDLGVDKETLLDRILTVLRAHFLDVISLGSIEVVQTCVLLGSYYLYNGEPELAWPLCGCGLRVAQALNLHRRIDAVNDPDRHVEETRKRCWWAVYEIETFCSMLYGFPLGILDSDCDIDFLDPYDPSSSAVNGQSAPEATLLSYKYAMAQLSTVVKSALVDLYSSRRDTSTDKSARMLKMFSNVEDLDKRLRAFYASLPERLRTADFSAAALEHGLDQGPQRTGGALDVEFQCHLFRLQALALKLAYESARILIHRPLLSCGIDSSVSEGEADMSNRIRYSIRVCRDAALEISKLGPTSIFNQASDTYAVAFVSVHLLTAGITLCIMTSLDPLSTESHECKLGIRRLMEMQTLLKDKSIVAEQGHEVMKKLVSLVMAKELDRMLDFAAPEQAGQSLHSTSEAISSRVQERLPLIDSTEEQSLAEDVNVGIGDKLVGDTVDGVLNASFGFHEDSSFAQTLLDFGLTSNGLDSSITGSIGMFNDCFVSQDQGWIWDMNHYI